MVRTSSIRVQMDRGDGWSADSMDEGISKEEVVVAECLDGKARLC